MAHRLMQIVLPVYAEKDFEDWLEGRLVLYQEREPGEGGRLILNLLISAEEAEAVMDRFEQRFSGVEGAHVFLLPVEAVLPRPKPEGTKDKEKPDNDGKEAKKFHRVSRAELYENVIESFGVTRVYIALIVLSSLVAAVGLMRDDLAVIIGAMVIAPLLGPNVSLALATTLGDGDLARRALRSGGTGLALATLIALAAGALLQPDPSIPAIAGRTRVGLSDLVLALAAGSAGTFAFTTGLSGAVIGVMVAVALMPPLVTFGMLLGSGHPGPAFGALLLTAANIICVNLAGVATFLAQGVKPRSWWEADRAKRSTRIAVVIWIALLAALVLILQAG